MPKTPKDINPKPDPIKLVGMRPQPCMGTNWGVGFPPKKGTKGSKKAK